MIDSHCHLDRFEPEARAALLARAGLAGLSDVLTIGTRLSRADEQRAIARAPIPAGGPRVWCTIGTHPDEVEDEAIPEPEALARAVRDAPEIVGIGESGLDFAVSAAGRARQEASFRAHIRAARSAGVPLVIHARGADDDVARVLADETATGGRFDFVLHCFSSGRALAEAGIALGGHVSFSGILTFPKSDALREIARALPPERLLVETDAPFLAPVPRRGEPNEPGFVVHTAAVLADLLGMAPAALEAVTDANFRRLFRIAPPA